MLADFLFLLAVWPLPHAAISLFMPPSASNCSTFLSQIPNHCFTATCPSAAFPSLTPIFNVLNNQGSKRGKTKPGQHSQWVTKPQFKSRYQCNQVQLHCINCTAVHHSLLGFPVMILNLRLVSLNTKPSPRCFPY